MTGDRVKELENTLRQIALDLATCGRYNAEEVINDCIGLAEAALAGDKQEKADD